jgi:hypothetical protein
MFFFPLRDSRRQEQQRNDEEKKEKKIETVIMEDLEYIKKSDLMDS